MVDPCSVCFLLTVLFILSFLFMRFGVCSFLLWCYVHVMSRGVVKFRWCCVKLGVDMLIFMFVIIE
jgi:hypothetical protein